MRPQRVRVRHVKEKVLISESEAFFKEHRQPHTAENRMEMQIVKWTAEGAVKSNELSILRREGIRQLPEICWYLVSARGFP